MTKYKTDGKYYKIFIKDDNHINERINENGRKAGIQFSDSKNDLDGPVELEEVNIDDLLKRNDNAPINPYVQLLIDSIVAPYVNYLLEQGTDKVLLIIKNKVIPNSKNVIKEFSKNKKVYIEGIKCGLKGEEPKALRLMKAAEEEKAVQNIVVEETAEEIIYTVDELNQLVDIMIQNAVSLATCIKMLSNAVIIDSQRSDDEIEYKKKQIEALTEDRVMDFIGNLLKEKNRKFIDEQSLITLEAFHNRELIIEDRRIPFYEVLGCEDNIIK